MSHFLILQRLFQKLNGNRKEFLGLLDYHNAVIENCEKLFNLYRPFMFTQYLYVSTSFCLLGFSIMVVRLFKLLSRIYTCFKCKLFFKADDLIIKLNFITFLMAIFTMIFFRYLLSSKIQIEVIDDSNLRHIIANVLPAEKHWIAGFNQIYNNFRAAKFHKHYMRATGTSSRYVSRRIYYSQWCDHKMDWFLKPTWI